MDEVANVNPFASLTAEQLEALSLVRDGFTSKQIAQKLNISRWAVDQRVDRARARIGAVDRAEAARMLTLWQRDAAAIEQAAPAFVARRPSQDTTYEHPYEGFVREPQPLPHPIEYRKVGVSYAGPSTAADENRVREMPARFGESDGISLLRSNTVGESGTVKKPLHNLVLIVVAAVGLAVVLIALPSLVRNAQDLAATVRTYRSMQR